ncbi:hypothetical protein NY78_0803 [Desulfovibrio sp. TomC]|nr:hypothetical protein NY78_0803 [Desulfovibrio sp. TomC]
MNETADAAFPSWVSTIAEREYAYKKNTKFLQCSEKTGKN